MQQNRLILQFGMFVLTVRTVWLYSDMTIIFLCVADIVVNDVERQELIEEEFLFQRCSDSVVQEIKSVPFGWTSLPIFFNV